MAKNEAISAYALRTLHSATYRAEIALSFAHTTLLTPRNDVVVMRRS
jgi:hypothetical protein